VKYSVGLICSSALHLFFVAFFGLYRHFPLLLVYSFALPVFSSVFIYLFFFGFPSQT